MSQPARLRFKPDPSSYPLPERHLAPDLKGLRKCVVLFNLIPTVIVKNVSVKFKLHLDLVCVSAIQRK